MNIEAVRQWASNKPVQPFVIHLADGREILVPHPDFLLFPPTGRLLIVYQANESFNIIDTLLVTDVEVRPNLQAPQGTNGQ